MVAAIEDYVNLLGMACAILMPLLALLLLSQLEFSGGLFFQATQIGLLVLGGLLCFQGETRLFYQYHDIVAENFGYVLKLQGRGWVYLLAGLYCLGFRQYDVQDNAATTGSEQDSGGVWHSGAFGFLWYSSTLVMIAGGAVCLWMWKRQHAFASATANGAADADLYYAA